jgi:hypothetical protein
MSGQAKPRRDNMGTISGKAKVALAMCTGTAFLAGLFGIGLALSKTATANVEDDWHRFTVEVYLDGKTYKQVNADPKEPPNRFDPGDLSYIEGVLYPKGTLQSGKSDPSPDAARLGRIATAE